MAEPTVSASLGPKTMVPLSWVLALIVTIVPAIMWAATTTAGLRTDLQLAAKDWSSVSKDIASLHALVADKHREMLLEVELVDWIASLRRANPTLQIPDFVRRR